MKFVPRNTAVNFEGPVQCVELWSIEIKRVGVAFLDIDTKPLSAE